jgi:hypothetical protein
MKHGSGIKESFAKINPTDPLRLAKEAAREGNEIDQIPR